MKLQKVAVEELTAYFQKHDEDLKVREDALCYICKMNEQ